MKTLYKRIAHAIMAFVMLVSLTATVSASELHEFTAEDEPAEIYAILLETYGEDAANDYKWRLLAIARIISDFNDIDNHEIGSKDQYKFADRLIAADEANWIIRKADKTGKYESPIAIDCGFTTDDEPRTIYDTLLNDYGKDIADRYKEQLLWNAGIASITDDIDNYELGPKEQYETQDLDGAIWSLNRTIEGCIAMGDRRFSNPRYASPEAQVFDDVKPGSWYYEAVNAMAAGGLLTGYTDGLFHPDDPITIAQYSTVFAKIYGIHSTEWDWNYVTVYYYLPVYDTNGNITALKYHSGPTDENGYPYNTENGPRSYRQSYHWAQEDQVNIAFMAHHHRALQHEVLDEPVIRGQMLAEMSTLHVNKYGNDNVSETWTLDNIPDHVTVKAGPKTILGNDYHMSANIITAGNITETTWKKYAANDLWGYPDIIRAYNVGITTGVDDNHTCNPLGIVTRAQFCQMLYNMNIITANSVSLPKGGIM